jgi:hypothetical protein
MRETRVKRGFALFSNSVSDRNLPQERPFGGLATTPSTVRTNLNQRLDSERFARPVLGHKG